MADVIGEMVTKRIAPAAAQAIEHAIAETGGREVFFSGTVDDDRIIETVRVLSRGHETAVPALFSALKKGEVVIHNHPSGNVAPSEADLELASVYGDQGHGVYIVDNDVTQVYVVVEPVAHEAAQLLVTEELEALLAPESVLAGHLEGFEERPQQAEMIRAVAEAFNTGGLSVIEAPTGVGKTIAYLAPAVRWAVANQERVVISTKTINLQEQIIHKDIPLLQRSIDEKFTAVLVKGRGNYLCPSRLERAMSEAELFEDSEDRKVLRALDEWRRQTKDGTLSDLPFVPPTEVWQKVCSEADTCTARRCLAAGNCFLTKARREMAKADILVVNHPMLFADLAIKKDVGSFTHLAVLPAYRRVIWDEAHSIEDSATNYFGVEATRNGALRLFGQFIQTQRGRERGLLPYLRVLAVGSKEIPAASQNEILETIDSQLVPALHTAREGVVAAFEAARELTAAKCGQIGKDVKWRLTEKVLQDPELRDIHSVYIAPAADDVMACAKHTGELVKLLDQAERRLKDETVGPELAQLQSYGERLDRLASTMAEATSSQLDKDTVRWIEIDATNDTIVRFKRCPLEVGRTLADWVYPNLTTAVMTSATLSVGQKFDYYLDRTGLAEVNDREVSTLALDTPFDYSTQALLGIPRDIPPPDEREYFDVCAETILETLRITRGSAFVLFTSFRALDQTFDRIQTPLRKFGVTPLRQGSASRTALLERFRTESGSVLFGTDSFWEGVDVAGEALSCVILPRLPFRVPTEPILQARAEAIEAAGRNAFLEFTVPQAVIKFRQGFGRLIRRRSDQGAVVILDSRILTKAYGRMFLDSLPPMRVVKAPREGVLRALEKFFAKEEGES